MTEYHHTIPSDMEALAKRVEALTPVQFYMIAPFIMAGNIMRTRWLIHATVRFVCWKMSMTRAKGWHWLFLSMHRRGVDIFDRLQPALARHIRHGRDRYDKRSAGGLCQHEVTMLVNLLTYAEANA